MNIKIALDIDGVCADLVGTWQRYYRHAFDNPDFEHNGEWGLAEGTIFESTDAVFKHLDTVPGFYEEMDLVPGAQGGIWQLTKLGNRIDLVTNRSTLRQRVATSKWVEAWWPSASQPAIEFVPSYKGIIDAQVYVDDNPMRLTELVYGHHIGERSTGPRPVVVVFDQPYNDFLEEAPNLFRVKGWSDLVEALTALQAAGVEALQPWCTVQPTVKVVPQYSPKPAKKKTARVPVDDEA